MTSPADARQVLGVSSDAGADDIRRAYRRLARRHHPDAGGDASEFHRINQAAEVLLGRPEPAPPARSPSTSRMTRPSTTGRVTGTGWGESTVPRFHDAAVDLAGVDFSADLPDPPHPWTRERVALAAARPLEQTVVHPVTGVSRHPRSPLNRVSAWLASDLLARWWIRPSVARGVVGHDVELRLVLPSARTRRLADGADWPLGWTRERRPSQTVVTFVMTPSHDRQATAVRAADRLVEGLDVLGWPLDQWRRTADA